MVTGHAPSVHRIAFGVAGVSMFGLIVGMAGLAFILWGLLVSNGQLAVSGLLLAVLGAILVAIRWWLGAQENQEPG